MVIRIENNNNVDVEFTGSDLNYNLNYKITPKGTSKKVNFSVSEGEELVKSAVTCGCTSVLDMTKNSFAINYNENRIGAINQQVTLTFKSGKQVKIRLSGHINN